MTKRFIEESFPVKEISEISAKEKNMRHGHISTLHIWWSRKPLAVSRATNYAALIPAPKGIDEWEKTRQFIINLSQWENSLDHNLLNKAREDILAASGRNTLRVLDPFAGGGSIPLECLRLGLETHAVEYNPVAVLLLKCTLEYPQKYGKPKEQKWGPLTSSNDENPLLEDVKKWGNWILEEAKREIGKFYPEDVDGYSPVGYIWARTIPCQNPSCGAIIPLITQYWLVRKKNKKVSLYPRVRGKEITFKIVGDGYENMPEEFNPSKGTVSKTIVTCLACGNVIDAATTRKLFQEGKAGERMVAVVLNNPRTTGKKYRVATETDVAIFKETEKYLERKKQELMEKWGIDPVPDEPLPPKETLGFRVQRYGMVKWGDLFNSRQKLAMITFVEKVRESYERMLAEGYDKEYARAVVSYLSLMVDRLADKNANIVIYNPARETVEHVFGRQALPMSWAYVEVNPFTSVGWPNMQKWIERIIKHCASTSSTPANVIQASATDLPYPDNHFDAVFTDPPYYDNVPYSYLSDFFYVWLKRSVGDLYPELFATLLTPKSKEIVAYSHWDGGIESGKKYFEEMLKKAFKEIARVLKSNGIATIVYTHKSTSGWETLINSLLESDLVVTASWPIDTERMGRLRARKSAALASSIYFVCRKMARKETGWLNEVKEEIKNHIYEKLKVLWEEGISGADYFISAIGSAIEVFGKYETVMDYEGNEISTSELLDVVREIVTDYTVRQILHNGIAEELSPLTKFYILWRWAFGEPRIHFDDARKPRIHFDDARKLAQSTGVDLEKVWNKSFIKKENEFIRVLGPQERTLHDLKDSSEMIDVLHRVLLLWKAGKKEEMKAVLMETGYWQKNSFYRIAQAISDTMRMDSTSQEKKLLDGFLSGKDNLINDINKLINEMKEENKQKRLPK